MSDQPQPTAALPSEKTRRYRRLAGHTPALDVREKRKIYGPCRESNHHYPVVQPVVGLTIPVKILIPVFR
jgi:hypothetical protein